MINFFDIEIKRTVCHVIEAKRTGKEHATVLSDNELLAFNPEVFDLIKERLAKAAANQSKAFELQIADFAGGSVFSNCYKMKDLTEPQFIEYTQDIANLLAQSQKKNSIPGGNLIIFEAEDARGRHIYIIIKAEMHDALRYESLNQRGTIRILDDLFLSQQQKLYKFGVIYERTDAEKEEYSDLKYPNNEFGCFLYDAQFNTDSNLAKYFYEEFLGFSIESNAKIQSKKFFTNTENFIKANLESNAEKEELLDVLRHEFLDNKDASEVVPEEFAEMYFPSDEVKDAYVNDVVEYLPRNIVKDTTLIKSKLNRKKIGFPNNIMISGPNNTFDINVKMIKSKEELDDIEFPSNDYTILKIIGKPEQE